MCRKEKGGGFPPLVGFAEGQITCRTDCRMDFPVGGFSHTCPGCR